MKGRIRSGASFVGLGSALMTGFLLGLFPTLSKTIITSINPLFLSSLVSISPVAIFGPLSLSMRHNRKISENKKSSTNTSPITKSIMKIVLVSSLIGGSFGPIAYFYGLVTTPATDASLLANAELVFTIVIASIALKEKLTQKGLLAVILVSVGIVVVITNLRFSSSLLDITNGGHLLILLSSFCWGVDNNLITYASSRIDAPRFIFLRASIAGSGLLILSFLLGDFPRFSTSGEALTQLSTVFLVVLIIFGGALYFNFLVLRELGAIRSTLIFPISSLFGLAAAYAILHEEIGLYQFVAIGIIFVGMYLLTRSEAVIRPSNYDLP